MDEGKKLLGLFREEQKKRNHAGFRGCICNQCIEDMDKALITFREQHQL